MRIIRISIYLAAFITALLIGFNSGKKLDPLGQISNSYNDSLISPGVAIPKNNQFNFLIIGVDDMERPDAHLESIWLVAHAENTNNITLIPIFPSTEEPDQNLLLAGSFSMDGGVPGKEFWDIMRETSFWWKGYLLSDITSSIKLVDTLGGVGFHGQQMNGENAIASISPWENDPQIAVNHQKLFIKSICNQLASNQTVSQKLLSEVLEQDFRYTNQTIKFLTDFTSKASKNGNLTCNFPKLNTSTNLNP